jgi:hypothetical protein
LKNITIKQLRAFVAVAQTGSFTVAAARLYLTPSALSLIIKEMEQILGLQLFERSSRHNRPTQVCEEFLPLAKKVLEDLDRAVESTQDLQQKKRGTVRVACTTLYAATLLPKLIRSYQEQFPGIKIFVLDSLNQQALQRVSIGEADFGIAPQRFTPPELTQHSLMKDRFCLLCPKDHPFAKRNSITWTQALREPFISLSEDFTSLLQSDLSKHSSEFILQPTHSVSLLTTALGMVEEGMGITVQPEYAVRLAPSFSLVARRLTKPVLYRQISLFARRGSVLSPAAESFRLFLSNALKG